MPALRPLNFKLWSFFGLIYLSVRTGWRYFITGRSVTGDPRDNATMLHAATKDYRDQPTERLSGPVWQRLIRRWALLGIPGLLLATSLAAIATAQLYTLTTRPAPGWTRAPWLEIGVVWWALALVSALGWAIVQGVQNFRHRKTFNEFVYPTWAAACGVLNLAYHKSAARKSVQLPAEYAPADDEPKGHGRLARLVGWDRFTDRRALRRLMAEQATMAAEPEPGTELEVAATPGQFALYRDRLLSPKPAPDPDTEPPVRIYLPPGKCGAESVRKNLLQAVGPVLGMVDPIAAWQLRGSRPYVDLTPRRLPPAKVSLADVRRAMLASDIDHPVVGLGAGGKVVRIDYVNNSPHWVVSGGSGTGKSKTVGFVESFRMSCGANLIVVDLKRVSHRWAHNLPGCVYAWRIEECHDVLVMAGAELERRLENVLPPGDDPEAELVTFPVVDLLIEEANSLIPMLQAHWLERRRPTDPMASPAVAAIRRIIQMGREFRMHVVYAAQRASAQVFGPGGGDARESFAIRAMAKWTMQTWRMLAGGLPYVRPPHGGRGIWAFIGEDDQVDIVRVPLLSPTEMRELAMSGIPSSLSPMGGEPEPVDPEPEMIPVEMTLRKAVELLPGPLITYDAIQRASYRAGFPAPVGMEGLAKTYRWVELEAWKLAKDAKGIRAPSRPGIIYRFDTLSPDRPEVECGYIGQTVRRITTREDEHRGDKPWSDLIVGSPYVIWESDDCTPAELDAAELEMIQHHRPRYNYQGQEGAPWAVAKWDQVSQRHARDREKGLPPWEPVDVYTERMPMAALLDSDEVS